MFSNLTAIGISILLVNTMWFTAVTIIAKRSWGSFRLSGLPANFVRIARKQIGYGSKIFASGIISFCYEPITKILLSNFVGVAEVGFFDIALRMRNQVWNLLSKLIYPFFPYISHMNDTEKIRSTVHDLEKKILFVTIPLMIGIMFISHSFIRFWIGKNIEIISISFIFIVGGYLIGIVVLPTYLFLMAKGHPEKTILLQFINVVVNAVLFLVTFHRYGYYAAVIGNTGAILASFIGCLYYQSKFLKIFLFDSVLLVVRVCSLASALIAVGFLARLFLPESIGSLLIFSVIFSVVTILAFRLLRIFSRQDFDKYLGTSDNKGRRLLEKIFIPGSIEFFLFKE
jgi:O-antigen/teichoic acid export membrane protein